jgi:hypothetical protein
MKYTKITLLSLIFILLLAACGSAPVEQPPAALPVEPTNMNAIGTPQADETPAPASSSTSLDLSNENALSSRLVLAMGMLKLEETEYPVTKEQASVLLMLWQGLVNLSNSGTSAEAEVNALLTQIESTLTPEQIQLINGMKLTQTDTQAWAQENGITLGTGTGTGTGMGQGQGSNLTAEEKATRQAANNPTGDTSNRENSLSNALTQALIEFLENKIE